MDKVVLTVDDIADMFGVAKSTAYDYIAGIRAVSDTLGLSGKVHIQDYEFWLKDRLGRVKESKSRK